MSYRYVFSQMFDVRPRLGGGELDLEKIKKIEAILNLRLSELAPSERIIDLKPKRPTVKRLQPENEETVVDNRQSVVVSQAFKKSDIDFWPEFNEFEPPNRSNILSILEIIEATEQILKEKKGRDVNFESGPIELDYLNAAEPVLNIEPESILPQLDLPPHQNGQKLEGHCPNATDVNLWCGGLPLAEISSAPILDEPIGVTQENDVSQIVSNPYFPAELERKKQELDRLISQEIDIEPFWLKQRPLARESSYELIPPELALGTLSAAGLKSGRFWSAPIKFFFVAAVVIFALIPLAGWLNRVANFKSDILNSSLSAYQSLIRAKDSLAQANFVQAENNFVQAHDYFASADSQINVAGEWLTPLLEKIPGLAGLTSRIRLVAVGKKMSAAGTSFTQMINLFGRGQVMPSEDGSNPPLTSLIKQARQYLEAGVASLLAAQQDLSFIDIATLPSDVQPPVALLKNQLPKIGEASAGALDWTDKFLAILGENKAKKYLLIFQNNSEMRATGGFIGTYGLLSLDQGRVKNLFIDGIFNPDGQLTVNVVPPQPIQKISTAWSMHDANWFADFPTSAKKLAWFYEKTGGETTDGVISLTPTVIERLLKITGPIAMPEYGVKLDADNFVALTQYEVEVNYDKAQNQPKKILADFAPKFLDKLSAEIENNNVEVLKVINDCLKEKHILLYFSDAELEKFVVNQGWGGELKESPQDYLAVVDSNIDGRKTDRVIDENIKLSSQIEPDGAVIDTLTVTRHHQGGVSQLDWFNHVNPDYLRAYLPKGAELISVSGQTKEIVKAPIDYTQAGFKIDSDVAVDEQTMWVDAGSGTQIFEETGKTVFGNWVYVSPGETVTLVYQYRLPYKLNVSGRDINYSILAQKQSGSVGRQMEFEVIWPTGWRLSAWPAGGEQNDHRLNLKTSFDTDQMLELNFSNGQ